MMDRMISSHFVNFTQDGTESRRECVALFGEQRVPGLCTLETGFGVCEGHPCWKDCLAWACAGHDDDGGGVNRSYADSTRAERALI
jgi:hypothetical protein